MIGIDPDSRKLTVLLALAFFCAVAAANEHGAQRPAAETRTPALAAASGASNGTADSAMPSPAHARRSVRYVWRINHGDRISDAFRAWARQSRKWQVVWDAPELISDATVDVDGGFEDAVVKVIEALNRGDARLVARFYVDSANNVLRVLEKK